MNRVRQPIIAVLAHVDNGKTKLLDGIRSSSVAEKEAGKITQHIGVTEIPVSEIKKISGSLLEKFKIKIDSPGLLFIDTPGHEAFTSLRERGSSIAELAVLVIDITQGIQRQTIESIELLKIFKTPFLIALNKIDKIPGWNSQKQSFLENMPFQREESMEYLNNKIYELIPKMYELGFHTERFDLCRDFTKEIATVPCSAETKEGIPEILMVLTGLSQKYLKEDLVLHEQMPAKGTILEKKEEKGIGTTIDVIIFEGSVKVNDRIIFASLEGTIKTKIRSILKPSELVETKASISKFIKIEKATAAVGIKIVAPELENALVGTTVIVYRNEQQEKEAEKLIKEEVKGSIIESQSAGVIIKADTLGALEGIIKLFEESDIKIRKASIGMVTKKDVIEALTVKETNPYDAMIFAFNVEIEENALGEARKRNISIIKEKVIYKLIDEYNEWLNDMKNAEKNIKLKKLIFPVKIRILPGHIFRISKPAIVGVEVLEGRMTNGIKLSKEGEVIGEVKSIQLDGKEIKKAGKGEIIAVSISDAVAGKTIREEDELVSFIPKKQFKDIEKYLELTEGEQKLLEEIKVTIKG